MTTYIFPGQGSQAKEMGKMLFPKFQNFVHAADDVLGYSIEKLCLEDPEQQLNQTKYTQPALYVVSALTYFDKIQETGAQPTYTAGHSLGEYNALLAAKVFDFETGLKLVKKRGELMNEVSNGAMAAIVGLKSNQVSEILNTHHLPQVAVANYNTHLQVIISGSKNDVDLAMPLFEKAGAIMVKSLKVSGAFHSPLMKPAKIEFEKFLAPFNFSSPQIPVIANTSAKPYQTENVKNNLVEQISSPVRWTESVEYLLAQGETEFEEIGPGKVLTGLVRRIRNGQ